MHISPPTVLKRRDGAEPSPIVVSWEVFEVTHKTRLCSYRDRHPANQSSKVAPRGCGMQGQVSIFQMSQAVWHPASPCTWTQAISGHQTKHHHQKTKPPGCPPSSTPPPGFTSSDEVKAHRSCQFQKFIVKLAASRSSSSIKDDFCYSWDMWEWSLLSASGLRLSPDFLSRKVL